jgi:hypothetical protein
MFSVHLKEYSHVLNRKKTALSVWGQKRGHMFLGGEACEVITVRLIPLTPPSSLVILQYLFKYNFNKKSILSGEKQRRPLQAVPFQLKPLVEEVAVQYLAGII